jgi:hypothetical protein
MIKEFKNVGDAPTITSFPGEKIRIEKVLNVDIIVHGYKVEPSNFRENGDGMRMVLSITKGDERRIIFTSSLFLRDQIMKISKDDFPFKSQIKLINEHYEFT